MFGSRKRTGWLYPYPSRRPRRTLAMLWAGIGSGDVESRATPPGWYADPRGRFEYRYYNGVQWTSDVAVNGQRYIDNVDIPPAGETNATMNAGGRGMAIAAFVTGLIGVVLGWVPFIFVIAACCAVAAIVFGILGLQAARRRDGLGRGFAVTGIVLAPVALAVCVGGFFFTRAVVREVRNYIDPGPHQLTVDGPCRDQSGVAALSGRITNTDDRVHDYRVVVRFTSADESFTESVGLRDVRPGASAPWNVSRAMAGSPITCDVEDVFGPLPFDAQDG